MHSFSVQREIKNPENSVQLKQIARFLKLFFLSSADMYVCLQTVWHEPESLQASEVNLI